jgi:hypothetical protein
LRARYAHIISLDSDIRTSQIGWILRYASETEAVVLLVYYSNAVGVCAVLKQKFNVVQCLTANCAQKRRFPVRLVNIDMYVVRERLGPRLISRLVE